jgi:peptide/nickel transport system substrate-binding protein
LPRRKVEATKLHVPRRILLAAWAVSGFLTARCGQSTGIQQTSSASLVTLKIGIGQLAATSEVAGVQQLKQILSREGLVSLSEDGRPQPALAESWNVAPNGLSLSIRLRSNAKFHDGTAVDAETVAGILRATLPSSLGSAFEDIDRIATASGTEINITLRRPSPLLIEALESQIRKPDGSATGPFKSIAPDKPELVANDAYYLGKPSIDRIVIQNYPSMRAAWAEMLRNNTDMLYEVDADALDSLTGATNMSLFTFVRHYQQLLIFNPRFPAFREPTVRHALNTAINRDEIIAVGLNGHGVPSSGPIWPEYWAFQASHSAFEFDPGKAATILRPRNIRFVCLVAPRFERVALALQRQLGAVGVQMELRETSLEALDQNLVAGTFDAVLTELISAPSFFRVYEVWHSRGLLRGIVGNDHLNGSLDRVRFAANKDEFESAIRDFQDAIVQDPPAIFLAWSERARAVNLRFDVAAQPRRDILTTLRLWRPVVGDKIASRN